MKRGPGWGVVACNVKTQCQNLNCISVQTTGVVLLAPNFINHLVISYKHYLHQKSHISGHLLRWPPLVYLPGLKKKENRQLTAGRRFFGAFPRKSDMMSFYYFYVQAFPAKQIAPRAFWRSLKRFVCFPPVTVHHSPPPASQTIKLGRTPLGIIMNNSWYSDGVQTSCFHGFQKVHIFA